MQSSKERAVFVSQPNERIYFLLERQIDPDPHRPGAVGGVNSFVRSLHQSWTTASDDVAADCGKLFCNSFRFFVSNRTGLRSRRSKNRHAITVASRRPQASQIIDDIP